jgi:uncharacterized membrane protein
MLPTLTTLENNILDSFAALQKKITKLGMLEDLKQIKALYDTMVTAAKQTIHFLNQINSMISIVRILPSLLPILKIDDESGD